MTRGFMSFVFHFFSPGGGFNATIITAVAAQVREGQRVEVKVTTSVDGVQRLRVYVDGVITDFPPGGAKWLDLLGR